MYFLLIGLYLAAMMPLSHAALPAMSKETCDAFSQKLQAQTAAQKAPNGIPDLGSTEKKPFVPVDNSTKPSNAELDDLRRRGIIHSENGNDAHIQKIIKNNIQNSGASDTGAQMGPTQGTTGNDAHSQLQRQVNNIGSLANLNTVDGVKPPPMPKN